MPLSSLIPPGPSLTLLASLLLVTGPASLAVAADVVPVAPAPRPTTTFSVAEIGPATLPRSLTADLEAAAAAGLAAAGAKVVPRVPASPSEQRPNTLLRGTCQVDGSTYRMHLLLEDARSGAPLVSRDDVCEICTEKDAAETVNIAASALKTALDHAPRPSPVVAVPAPRIEARPAPAPRASRVPWRRVLPWVAVAAGAAGIGVGAYYLAIDGDPVDCKPDYCPVVHDTKTWGIAGLAAGAAVAATGLVFVFTAPRAAPAAENTKPTVPRTIGLTLLPDRLAAWGTF